MWVLHSATVAEGGRFLKTLKKESARPAGSHLVAAQTKTKKKKLGQVIPKPALNNQSQEFLIKTIFEKKEN